MAHPDLFILTDDADAACRAAEELFETVRGELSSFLPASAEVLHIGATAIPGCLTKGDLDLVVRVERADFLEVEARLAALFSGNIGSMRTEEFSAFEDASRTPHLGIQLAAKGGAFDFFEQFAEALRADPELVRSYNALKLAHHHRPMAVYREAKDAFVTDVLRSRYRGLYASKEKGRWGERP